ncbi:DUF5684 domain-containing protein [Clostridium sp. AN503]|uniref:DUF5684 domain-containing protein n=1 Tax=Clostridium sp. AN503 TaxID=3160598 RepID=UPI0034577346
MSESAAVGILLASMGLVLVCVLGWYVIQAIALWRIFTKAGEAGWKSLIPFYNGYTQYKITWNTTMFWVGLAATIVGTFMTNMDGAVSIIGGVIALAGYIVNIIGMHKLSLAFGHGVGFTLGLIFLNPIFILILGFSGDQYLGPQ